MSDMPVINESTVETLLDTRFVKVYDLCYAPGKHYYDASRRAKADLVAVKSEEEAQKMLPDAVSCVVVLKLPEKDPLLLLTMEYRYPAGRFLLSVPAGLIDPEDKAGQTPLEDTARREIREETGITVKDGDEVYVINPFLYSTPGMSDESNALVGAYIHLSDLSELKQDGAVGSELFDGFRLVGKETARALIRNGRDDQGNFYSIFTFAALNWFVMNY